MTEGTKIIGKGFGVISGNLSFIGAFLDREDANHYYAESLGEIPSGWVVTEDKVLELNGKWVVRILAVKEQGEFDFG